MEQRHFRDLFQPGRIGQMELKNRIVMAPMGTYLANRDGTVSDRLKKYYEERARGGVGLIIVEVAAVDHPRGRGMTRQIGISDDKFLSGLSELAESIHLHKAKVSIQLHHGGRIASPLLSGGCEAVAPSVVPLIPAQLGTARELTISEIAYLIECYAQAALRARIAGFDGVEIHSGHGYLIGQFLSRSTNLRHDAYGGALENRARFLLEIIRAVRAQVGPLFPVWCRLDGREFAIENGITLDESLQIGRLAVEAGVDGLHISGYGGSDSVHFTEAPLVNEPGFLLPLARTFKRALKVPLIAVGRISPEVGEDVLRRGDADFIALGRPLIADPELPNKLADGKPEDIRHCTYCYTCVHQIFVRNNICCSINALAGKESEASLQPAVQVKKVLIVGGGPAGMEAARVAALRGHQVLLCEEENRLGGSLVFASLMRRENGELVNYLVSQLRKYNVQVKLGVSTPFPLIDQMKPNVIIVATGGVPSRLSIPGIERRNVLGGADLRNLFKGSWFDITSTRLTSGQKIILSFGKIVSRPFLDSKILSKASRWWMPLGKRIVVLGGGLVGCELAGFLAERRRKVTILEQGEQVADGMAIPMKWMILEKLERYGVDILTGVKFEKIDDRGIRIVDDGQRTRIIEAETMIDALGVVPDEETVGELQNKAPEVYAVGDCSKLSFVKDSIAEASRVARTI